MNKQLQNMCLNTEKTSENTGKRILFFKTILLLILFITCGIYLFWRFYYTIPRSCGYISLIAGYMLFIAEAVGFIESSIFYLTLWNINTPSTPEVHNAEFPHVDVFVATYNESRSLLYKTIIGCKNMDYPDKNKVHIYICDDGNRKEIADLCTDLEVNYITRTDNTHAKAGNLNNALSKTSSPYIVTFDADMIPMHDFLMKTIPFFIAEENIGFVQLPQNFYNPDSFQYNLFSEQTIPNEQTLFSRLIQAGKNRFNAVIYAGSNTVLSRKALNEINGFAVGTITEDFITGMKIQSKGYKCIYLNEVHASGLSPESLEDLFNQRIRWARGVIQTFKACKPLFMKGLSIFQKLMYFSAFSYWYFGIWRFIFFAAPILFSVFGIVVLSASAKQVLAIWLPMFIFTNLTFAYFTKGVRTASWSHIYDTILFPHIIKNVLKETIGFKMSKFKVTPKENIKRESFVNSFELVRVQIIIALFSLAGIIRIIYLYFNSDFQSQYLINFFWLSYNCYLLFMAIFFASERPKFRNSERFSVSEDAFIETKNGKNLCGKTADISETGVSIILDKPVYLDLNSNHNIKIKTLRNSSSFSAEIVRVDNFKDKFKYVFRINEIDEKNFSELLLILYDRIPPFPEKQKGSHIINNMIKNIVSRRKKLLPFNRKLPRININKDIKIIVNGNPAIVHISDFNFMYIAVKSAEKYTDFIIPVNEELDAGLHCVLDETLSGSGRKNISIYKITNYSEFADYDLVSILKSDVYTAAASLINCSK